LLDVMPDARLVQAEEVADLAVCPLELAPEPLDEAMT
jgi:hypothetical protein